MVNCLADKVPAMVSHVVLDGVSTDTVTESESLNIGLTQRSLDAVRQFIQSAAGVV